MTDQISPPNPEVTREITSLLISKNVNMYTEDVELVVAAMSHWLEHNKRGQEFMAHLLQLDARKGKTESIYQARDGKGRLTEIEPERIVFLRGCLINGEPYPVSYLDIKKRVLLECDSCGSQVVCSKNVVDEYGEILDLCSRCMQASEHQKIRDVVEIDCSSECTYSHCNWHPVNQDVPPFTPLKVNN